MQTTDRIGILDGPRTSLLRHHRPTSAVFLFKGDDMSHEANTALRNRLLDYDREQLVEIWSDVYDSHPSAHFVKAFINVTDEELREGIFEELLNYQEVINGFEG